MSSEHWNDERSTSSAVAEVNTVGVTRIHDWFRLLRALLAIMLPTAIAGMLATTATTVAGRPPASDIIAMIVNVVVHTCFWVSLVYAYVDWRERTGEVQVAAPPSLSVIRPESLALARVPSTRRVSLGEVIGPLSLWASFVAFSFGQRRIAPITQDIEPVLDSAAWPRWMPIVAWMAANVCAALIATFRMGRWTPATAGTAIATTLFVVAGVTRMTASETWISDGYLAAMRLTASERRLLHDLMTVASLVIVYAVAVWTIVIAVRGWRRDRAAPPLRYTHP